MKGYVADIERVTLENTDFRRVLYTAKNCQLVVMSLNPGEDIGEEVHTLDRFFRCEQGTGKAILDGTESAIASGTACSSSRRRSFLTPTIPSMWTCSECWGPL